MTEKSTALCPCQSGQTYQGCCEPFHLYQQFPHNGEQLMRSRYSAYTLNNIKYIAETTVPNQQALLDLSVLRQWAQTTQWLGLEVIKYQSLSKQHSKVEFNAFFATAEGKQAHHEHSLFVNIANRWYFVDPTVNLPTMKQPCLCGSGKKFKHCCGGLL